MAKKNKSKKLCTVSIYDGDGEITYKGRLLGLITNQEYAALVRDKEVRRRALSSETLKLSVLSSMEDVSGLRLVLDVRERGKTQVTAQRALMASAKLSYIAHAATVNNVVSLNCENGAFIHIEEVSA